MSTDVVTRIAQNIKKVKLRVQPQIVDVNGEIDEDVARDFADQMLWAQSTGQPVIPIMIHSTGGDVYSLIKMINCIKQCNKPIATVVTGVAASAAACLFTCAPVELRFMSPDARLMIHSVSSMLFGSMNAASMKAEAKEAKKLNQRLFEMMAENCGKPSNYFEKLIRKNDNTDVWIDCKKALQMGLVTRTEIPVLVSNVEQTFSFETMDGRPIPIPDAFPIPIDESLTDRESEGTAGSGLDSDSADANSSEESGDASVSGKKRHKRSNSKSSREVRASNKVRKM